jgi:hypothetical protein
MKMFHAIFLTTLCFFNAIHKICNIIKIINLGYHCPNNNNSKSVSILSLNER